MEVFAGFTEHVDVQVGRVVDEIDRLGFGENTLIFYIWGDNGASAEGQDGTISELLAQNGIPSTTKQQIAALDGLGSSAIHTHVVYRSTGLLKAIIFDMDDTLLDWEPREQDWFEYERLHLDKVYAYASRLHPLPDFYTFAELEQAVTVESWMEGGQTLEAPNLGHVLAETLLRLGFPAEKIDIVALLEAYDWQGLPGVLPFPECGCWKCCTARASGWGSSPTPSSRCGCASAR